MFKIKGKEILMLAAVAAVMVPIAASYGASTTVSATVNFRRAIALSAGTTLDFSKVDYSNTTVSSSDSVTINAATGAAAYAGNFTAGAGATPTRGVVATTAADALAANLTCSTTATLKNGANTIQVTAVSFSYNGGAQTACTGAAQAVTLASGAGNTWNFGGKLDGGTASGNLIASGAYSTATGTPISVDVSYQ